MCSSDLYRVSAERSAVNLMGIPLYVICCFSLAAFFKLIYFWLRWVFIAAHGLFLVAVSRGLLIAVASLVAEQEL